MFKIKLKIRELFQYLNIDSNQYETELKIDNKFYIETPDNKIVKINCFVKKHNNLIYDCELSNGVKFRCSENHIVVSNNLPTLIKYANTVLTKTGYVDIISKYPCKIDDVYDLSIPSPHLYLTPNGIIHHNTTLAKIVVLDILKCDYLYINASDENGIDTVRTKISGFVQTKSFDGNRKVVILDEADSLSFESQNALRNMMESYVDTARFILTGNYRHKIGVPLQSRCQRLDLTFTLKDVVLRVLKILEWEKITPTLEEKQKILEICRKNFPDLRRCINEIQKCWINGVFVFEELTDNAQLVQYIWKNVKNLKSFETRKHLIENYQVFDGDWKRLSLDLINYVFDLNIPDTLKRNCSIIIADHLEKFSRVDDFEINFYACLLNMEKQVE